MQRLIRDVWQEGVDYLQRHGNSEAAWESELLLRHILKQNRAQFFACLSEVISDRHVVLFDNYLKRRVTNEPLQYIIGEQEFYGRIFKVTPAVLVPRPETEQLIELALKQSVFQKADLCIADLGTGSGAIALTIAAEVKDARVYAVDISVEALAVARGNAIDQKTDERVKFLRGNFLEPLLNIDIEIDVLLSNPPYIAAETISSLQAEVAKFEPLLALDGGADGLDAYRLIIEQISCLKVKPRLILFEIGDHQGAQISNLAGNLLSGYQCSVHLDLAQKERFVMLKRCIDKE